jgi:riboflavin kinase/FMN adenylyltransferase
LYCLRFNKALAQLSPEAFVKNILVDELKANCVVVGHNFHFGAKRAGNIDTLKSLGKQYGFQVIIVDSVQHKEDNISSTRLRQHLSMGDFQSVNVMTGRPYRISGRVTYGNQIGRTLGYPTANLRFGRKTIPVQGIFIVLVHGLSDTPLQGVASSGFRPTFDGKELILEVYIFNFDQEIYGKRIQIEFLRKIRDEIKFDSVTDLIKQMDDDAAFAKAFFCFY